MSKQNKLNIGLFGFGVVGEGLYKVLQQTPGLNAFISKICIRHPEKERNAPQELFTTSADALLDDDAIDVIVELIDDADAAYHIVTSALRKGKAVVSASKKMIAAHLEELIRLQFETKTPFLYEAACCASIPVIRNLEEYYDNDLLKGIQGIVNGSTNYILTKVNEEQLEFSDALKQAQQFGFAESDPSLDVNGTDAANKLCILLAHAYGILSSPDELFYCGIRNLHPTDASLAREKGYAIKLVATARKLSSGEIAAFVAPQFVAPGEMLSSVRFEYNGLIIESTLADRQFFLGKGAGGFPTASAVLSDISALQYRYRYEYKKLHREGFTALSSGFYLKICAGFPNLRAVQHERFDRILEWNSNDDRCHVTGIIHSSELLGTDWWKQSGISVILYPDAILDDYRPKSKASDISFHPAEVLSLV